MKKKKLKYILNNALGFLLFIISYYCYFLSLEKCLKGEEVCCTQLKWIKQKIKQFIISVLIIIFLIILIFYNILSKLHIIHFLITFIFFYRYSHSVFFYDHGGLNLVGFFVSIFISLIIIFILKFFFSILKIKYKYKIISIITLLSSYNVIFNPINCNDWEKGLNNTYIENDVNKYGCWIRKPKKCEYKIFQYIQDFNKLSGKTCANKNENSRENILKYSKSPYVNSFTKKFGFPLTNNEAGRKDGIYDSVLRRYTYKNLIDMDKTIPKNLSRPEYIVDFSKDPLGNLIINLNYNESLSKLRKKKEKNSPYSKNILIIYLDSISRANSIRKLKKTLKFFEQFISFKGGHHKNYPNENFHSFQFFKYHAHEEYTSINFPILFYGNKKHAKKFVRISKYLKENGYLTSYTTDVCIKDNTRTRHKLSREELYDHQLLLCDPNAPHINTITKRCLYGNLIQANFGENIKIIGNIQF